MRILSFLSFILLLASIACQKEEPSVDDVQIPFLNFASNGQTLPADINPVMREVEFEVDHDVDMTSLVPEFGVPEGCSVFLNGIKQVSGLSAVDFSEPVIYELKDAENRSAIWKAEAVKLKVKILIDASHDGGVWWFPQGAGMLFDQDKPHQGKIMADLLRKKGFEVDELGRGTELTEKMFFGYYIVIRAGGFETYTTKELNVYTNLIKRGMNLAFFTDHKKYDVKDELGDFLGLKFKGIAYGNVTRIESHMITTGFQPFFYNAGSVLTDYEENKNIQILGWLGDSDFADMNWNGVRDTNEPYAPPVMGILKYPKSKIFFIGDMNALELRPQPFIDNLCTWMGVCFDD